MHYRANFTPSRWRAKPHSILAVAAVAAETDAEAERHASSMDLNRLRRDRGQYLPLPSIEEAEAYPYTDADRAFDRPQPLQTVRRQPGHGAAKTAAADYGERSR